AKRRVRVVTMYLECGTHGAVSNSPAAAAPTAVHGQCQAEHLRNPADFPWPGLALPGFRQTARSPLWSAIIRHGMRFEPGGSTALHSPTCSRWTRKNASDL